MALLLILLQPAYANGGHMHLGGIFFLLFGGLVFVGGLIMVLYMLFRADPEETSEPGESD
jgi:hypothetical protein